MKKRRSQRRKPASPAIKSPDFVVCKNDGSDDLERRAWAQDLVGILLDLPQPDGQRPAVFRSGREREPAQYKEPISHRQLAEQYDGERPHDPALLGPDLEHRRKRRIRVIEEREFEARVRETRDDGGESSTTNNGASAPSSSMAGKDENGASRSPGRIKVRPGTGGRQRRDGIVAETEATAEIREKLGEPEVITANGVRLEHWRAENCPDNNGIIYKDGDGGLVGRLSTSDLQKGETGMGQVHAQRRLAIEQGLKPRELVMSLRNGGGQRYENRLDFEIIEAGIRSGALRWVAFRAIDRIGRDGLPRELFYDLCKRTGTELYISDWGRQVNWDEDQILLSAHGMVANEELKAIKARTQGAIKRRWLEEGRGHPTQIYFGFRRNEDKFLEVDPEQWEWVKRIHYGYADFEANGGLRGLNQKLGSMGLDLSTDLLRTVLKDPIYVTGEWSSNYQGQRIKNPPIPLPDPIPADIYERNQQILRLRKGRHKKTSLGTFVLNRVRFVHANCRHIRRESQHGHQPLLRARNYQDGKVKTTTYAHTWPVPECCRGYSLNAAAVDAAVIRALQELCRNPEMQKAFTDAALPDLAERTPLLAANQKEELKDRIATLESQLDRLDRDWVDRLAAGEELTEETHDAAVAPVKREIEKLKRRMENADVQLHSGKEAALKLDQEEREDLLARMDEILTEEVPEDPELRLRRAAFVETALSLVVVHDVPDERPEELSDEAIMLETGKVMLELHGPLLPYGSQVTGPFDPLAFGKHALEDHAPEGTKAGDSKAKGASPPNDGASSSSAEVRSQTDGQVWSWQPVWEPIEKPERDAYDLAQDAEVIGDPIKVQQIYGQWRVRRFATGLPAWRSPRLTVDGVDYRRKPDGNLSYSGAVEALVIAICEMPPGKLFANLGTKNDRCAYEIWREEHQPSLPSIIRIGKAAKKYGLTPDDLARHAIHCILTEGEIPAEPTNLRVLLRPPTRSPRDAARRTIVDGRAVLTFQLQIERCRNALIALATELPEKRPFGPLGYQRFLAKDDSLPTYGEIKHACQHHGYTPLQLVAEAREIRAQRDRSIPESKELEGSKPEPADEFRSNPSEDEAVLSPYTDTFGEEALEIAIQMPRTTPETRGRLSQWTLNECLDALITCLPELEAGREWGRAAGYEAQSRGRRHIPSYPTLMSVCRNHGLSHHRLLRAARELFESSRPSAVP